MYGFEINEFHRPLYDQNVKYIMCLLTTIQWSTQTMSKEMLGIKLTFKMKAASSGERALAPPSIYFILCIGLFDRD